MGASTSDRLARRYRQSPPRRKLSRAAELLVRTGFPPFQLLRRRTPRGSGGGGVRWRCVGAAGWRGQIDRLPARWLRRYRRCGCVVVRRAVPHQPPPPRRAAQFRPLPGGDREKMEKYLYRRAASCLNECARVVVYVNVCVLCGCEFGGRRAPCTVLLLRLLSTVCVRSAARRRMYIYTYIYHVYTA